MTSRCALLGFITNSVLRRAFRSVPFRRVTSPFLLHTMEPSTEAPERVRMSLLSL
jgi:hypothetical protein